MATLRTLTVTAFSVIATLASAAPVILGFEGLVDDAGQILPAAPYTESGYTLTNTAPGAFNDGIFGKDASNSNGSATFVFCSYDSHCFDGTSIVLTGAAPFSLKSIDIGTWERGDRAGTVELIGTLLGGGTVTAALGVSDTWTSKLLSGFDHLVSVEFKGHSSYAIAFDNLLLDNGASHVPEPGSLALATLALVGLGLSKRRQRC